MKSITVATIATVILSLLYVDEAAAEDKGDATVFSQVTAKSGHLATSADHQAIRKGALPAMSKGAGSQLYFTRSLAPVMDATQPPASIRPPILAGTIKEDPPIRDDRNRKRSKDRNQGKGLFDRFFRRN